MKIENKKDYCILPSTSKAENKTSADCFGRFLAVGVLAWQVSEFIEAFSVILLILLAISPRSL